MYTAQQLKIARKTLRTNVIANAIAANNYAFCTQQQVNKHCVTCTQNDLCNALYFAQQHVLQLQKR